MIPISRERDEEEEEKKTISTRIVLAYFWLIHHSLTITMVRANSDSGTIRYSKTEPEVSSIHAWGPAHGEKLLLP